MEAYTIEDVELLRRKSGMSYQEAVALLEYHNGNLARALIDLERNGKLKDEKAPERSNTTKAAADGNAKKGETKEKAINLLQKLYRCRVKVHKGDIPVVNVSVLYGGAALLFAPHLTVAGIIIAMILGYRFSFSQMDEDFASDNLKQTVKNAAENARASVDSVVKTIQKTAEQAGKAEKPAQPARPEKPEIPEVPTIQVPVQAEAREGSVSVDEDQNGYHSVTIG
jgi:hypothetical protein